MSGAYLSLYIGTFLFRQRFPLGRRFFLTKLLAYQESFRVEARDARAEHRNYDDDDGEENIKTQ